MIFALVCSFLISKAAPLPNSLLFFYRIEDRAITKRPDGTFKVTLKNQTSVEFTNTLQKGMQIVFEDKMPGANWAHPAVLKLLSPFGSVIEEIEVFFPPRGRILPLLSDFLEPMASSLPFSLSELDGKYRVADPSNFYAVLLNGDGDERHWNDFSFLYRGLTQVYGYDKNNIFILDSNYLQTKNDLDGDGKADILYSSDFESLSKVFKTLSSKMKKNDHLFMVANDHGEIVNGEAVLLLPDRKLRAGDFTKFLRQLPSGKKALVFGQCYGGGFVRPVTLTPAIAISASTNEEVSWATSDYKFDEFIYHFSVGLFQQTYDGKTVFSDFNRDGKISFTEAYAYAVAHDKKRESPLSESPKNSGLASSSGLSF